MSEGSISQEEIDALLSGVDMGGLSSSGSSSTAPSVNIDIATLQKLADSLKGPLAENLKTFTSSEVSVDTPSVEALDRDQMLAKIPEMVIAVMADFQKGLSGDHLFVISHEFATKIVSLVNNEENPDIDDMTLSTISETVSMHSGSEITELSKSGTLPGLEANVPEAVNLPKAMIRIPQGTFALFSYPINMAGTPFTLWEAVSGPVAEGMVKALGGGQSEAPAAASMGGASMGSAMGGAGMGAMGGATMGSPMGGAGMGAMGMGMGMQQPMQNMGMGMMPNMGMQQPMQNMGMGMGMMPNMGMQQMQQMPQMVGGMPMTPPSVQQLSFPNLQASPGAGEQGNIGLIMDVYMEMTVELGRTKKTIKDILGMGEGTIIELDKLAGEPVDILVNHKPIAKGEVVVIEENFGVRVTEILPSLEHVASTI